MLTTKENDLLTRTGPGTPAGELLRRYWQPAALAEEIPPGGAPVPLRLLGEDLVLFRDEEGRPGLLGLHCAHRGADLSYGRLEDGGLRCIYHGWLYDIQGRCLEQPGEPAGSTFHERIRQTAYPCVERSGAILAYMGPGEPPLFPNYQFLTVPDDHTFAIKLFSECNYLQGNEGNLDLIHLSLLHHLAARDASVNGAPAEPVTGQGAAPHAEVVEAELMHYGLKVCKVWEMGPERHFYLGTYVIPSAFAFSGNVREAGYSLNWHVPIDDTHHWKFTFIHSTSQALDKDSTRRGRLSMTPYYRPLRNRENRFQQDRSTMDQSYTGIGNVFQAHDLCVTEGAGPIEDRTQEHLAGADAPLVVARKLLMKGIKDIQEGLDPPNVIRDPARNQFPQVFACATTVPAETDWRAFFRQLEGERVSERQPATAR
jgi:phenylpropionate dioxygenase-like ring-hydroxylating dioxygenase large terminal subunit